MNTPSTAHSTGHSAQTLRGRLATIRQEVLDDLIRLASIPSIAWPEADPSHVEASTEAVAGLARQAGFHDVEVVRAPREDGGAGRPAVIGSIPAPPGRPTVLLYAHHDVQPTGDPAAWSSPPFEPEVRGDRLYGRGTADDKAGIMVHLAAVRILGASLGVGVTLFIEGEEEIGSPSIRRLLDAHLGRLRADVIVVADSANWARGVPALTTSLRGMATLDVTLRTLDHSLHSGVYGGAVPDAMLAMTRMLSTLHDSAGAVAVDGLLSAPAGDADLPAERLRADAGVLPAVELIGRGPVASRMWHQPAITVTGLDLPASQSASNTLHAALTARLSIRVAPGDEPLRALELVRTHLIRNAPFGAELSFGDSDSGRPWQADLDDPVVDHAVEALRSGYGAAPVLMGLGGSIPLIGDLQDAFPQASILVTGIEDPDARAHAIDESLYLPDLDSAIVAEALLLQRLASS